MAPVRNDLCAAMQEAWRRSDQLFGLLSPEALLARPIRLRQPFLFYLGHLPAFAWNHLGRRTLARAAFAADLDALFEAGIDPPDDAEPAGRDEATSWPAVERVLAYRDRVRSELRGALEDTRVSNVLAMVLEHELMHHETLMYMLQELPADAKHPPADLESFPAASATGPRRRVRVPAGAARLGASGGGFVWDNERPQLERDTPAFEIDALPVTNREFREFVCAGGYADRRLWDEDAWHWLQRTARAKPHTWTSEQGQWRVATLFGSSAFDVAADWPACVSHCEAQAFARWSGARLPTEDEFHRAAFGTPDGDAREHPWGDALPAPAHGNLGFRHWGQTPVGAHPAGVSAFGVHELVGNGWEWTGTPFRPFPGFQPQDGYAGYSANFFDERHFVLLGGSWATDLRLVRRSFRNWFQPHYPYVFAKFRRVFAPGKTTAAPLPGRTAE
jgi:ergothioneine biosynthesis protein EgtB